MAIKIDEQDKSRTYGQTKDGRTFTTRFNVYGTTDPFEAANKLPFVGSILVIDGTTHNLFVDNVSIDQEPGAKAGGEQFLRATITYGKPTSEKNTPPDPEANIATWKLSTAAQVVHIETVLPDTKQEFIPDNSKFTGTAIGYSNNGIQGVDVLRSNAVLTIQHWLPVDTANAKFLDAVNALSASVNDAKFDGPWGNWLSGEVLYMGAEITSPNNELISFTHTFQRSLELKVVKVKLSDGKVENFPKPKQGWDYFWTRVEDSKDADNENEILTGNIVSAHIGKVYERKSFKDLKLPKDFIGGQ